MHCISCGRFSFSIICKDCVRLYCTPSIKTKTLECGLRVVGFYNYDDIELLIKTKYTSAGYFVFNTLANHSFKPFASHFSSDVLFSAVAIDDEPNPNGYSHTAILAKSLASDSIHPVYNAIRAKNKVEYAGKSKEFRINNPRNFKINKNPKNIILVDDIMTTGQTLTQAYSAFNGSVDFAMVLCLEL